MLSGDNGILVAMSGKMGAGKDTVGPLVMERLERALIVSNRRGNAADNPMVQLRFADALHGELDHIIRIISFTNNRTDATELIRNTMIVPVEAAEGIVDILWDDVNHERIRDSHARTASVREAMQQWGTGVRRAGDPDYWVDKTREQARALLAANRHVLVNDARFTNELDMIHELGGRIIRLDVSPEEQERRIMRRDGITMSTMNGNRNHPSETIADTYPRYDVRVSTDAVPPEQLADMIVNRLLAL